MFQSFASVYPAYWLMQISFSFDDAADKDYVFIAAGETKTVEHDRESVCTSTASAIII